MSLPIKSSCWQRCSRRLWARASSTARTELYPPAEIHRRQVLLSMATYSTSQLVTMNEFCLAEDRAAASTTSPPETHVPAGVQIVELAHGGRSKVLVKPAATSGPAPLLLLVTGFLVDCEAYGSYATYLSEQGFSTAIVSVDTGEEPLDDITCVTSLTDTIDWCFHNPSLSLAPDNVYLAGHSRGAKLAVLAGLADERVRCLCLIDPVDSTPDAPISARYPSAVAALSRTTPSAGPKLLVVGAAKNNDCIPISSNYHQFYQASNFTACEVVFSDVGHFQFLDSQTLLQESVCRKGKLPSSVVRSTVQELMVTWGRAVLGESGSGAYSLQSVLGETQKLLADSGLGLVDAVLVEGKDAAI